ncbi:ATP-binding protein [Quatrionicoccus australiensis]|uniref:ATP-binding protein n=1 Tax=Quatrionicoccus australiensis TaxID=138118 RepID=UPI001CF9A685|nr:ATP-binding protein [Quatrionicoccus australiensis]MCB4361699.1 ATP-binding protein [Quatrionicoccus australiensis]
MPAHSTDISVSARYSELPGLMCWLAEQAERFGLSQIDGQRLQLIVEELLTNTIRHGHGRECDAAVDIRFEPKMPHPLLTYSDTAGAFDPTRFAPSECTADIGGLGIELIRGMTSLFRYQRQNGRNIIELML